LFLFPNELTIVCKILRCHMYVPDLLYINLLHRMQLRQAQWKCVNRHSCLIKNRTKLGEQVWTCYAQWRIVISLAITNQMLINWKDHVLCKRNAFCMVCRVNYTTDKWLIIQIANLSLRWEALLLSTILAVELLFVCLRQASFLWLIPKIMVLVWYISFGF